jgi:precorrin-2 dehydrogenase/sirohydrochlorin ferrochelatase
VSRPHSYYPIFLDLEGRRVVVVGGGGVSARKVEAMIKFGARVTVIAPTCTEEISRWADEGRLTLARRTYESTDLDAATLVIASTNAPEVNAQIAADCRAHGILVNVVDDTSLCDFIVPAIVENGSIQIAISTGGRSPAFARVVKRDLQTAIGPEYAEMNDILGSLRDAAKSSPKLPADPDRKRFFDELIALGIVEMLRDGRRREAYRAVADLCVANDVALSELVRAGLEG